VTTMRSVETAVLAFLLNGTWQIALVAAAAAVASRMLRRFPALPRHAVWVAALGIALLLPAAQLVRRYLVANAVVPPTVIQPASQSFSVSRLPIATGTGEMVRVIPENSKASASVSVKTKRSLTLGGGIAAAIIATYAALMLWRLLVLALAWNRARLLARRARFVSLDARLREVTEACGAAFDGAKASLFSSSEIAAPATVGWLWPRILLPESVVREGDVDSLTAAIGHEMAHIARRDYLFNLICEFCYLPLAFQPAAAIVRRQIRRTRELRCDELVAERLMQPKNYARALVEMARAATKSNSRLTVAVGMSDGDILEERILSTLRRQNMKVQGKRSLLGIAAVVLIAPCAIAVPFALRVGIKDPALEARSDKRPDALPFTNTAQKDLAPTGALASGGPSSKFAKPVSDSGRAGARQAPVQSSKELRDRIDREVSLEIQMQTMIEQLQAKIEQDIQNEVNADEDRKKLSAAENQLVQIEQASENAAMKQKLERAIAEAREKVRQDERNGANADIDRKRLSELEQQMQGTGWQRLEAQASVQAMQRMAEELQAKIQHDQQTGANTESEQRQLLELKQKLEAVQKGGVEGEPGWAISNEGQNVEEVRQKLERLTEQLEKARQTESPDHPEVRQLEEQIAALKSRVEIETMNSRHEREEAMRKRQIELASKAKISMPDAIQIALQSHQGTVMQCVLRGERDMIFYNVGIFGDATFTVKDGNGNSSTKTVKTVMTVLVDAIDGHIIKNETERQ
jgi:beta-lactamase regulating signal transducer with metallopeptidase domain